MGVYDVIISSNTLEHFFYPYDISLKLSEHAKKYLIFLVPFQEKDRIPEHFYTFDYTNIPFKINRFGLRFFKEIDAREVENTYWFGKQILLIYQKDFKFSKNHKLADFGVDALSKKVDEIRDELEKTKLREMNLLKEKTTIEVHLNYLKKERDELFQKLEKSYDDYKNLEQIKNQLESTLKQTQGELERILKERNEFFNALNNIYSSDFWKAASFYYRLKEKNAVIRNAVKILSKLKRIIIKHKDKKLKKKSLRTKEKTKIDFNRTLKFILRKHENKPIFIFCPVIDWNIPLFQRPHHIAINLSKLGTLYFYCTTNYYDKINGFKKIKNGCYVTNQFGLIDKLKVKKVYHIHAADKNIDANFIEEKLSQGNIILYEYMDELHEDVSGKIPKKILDRHIKVLKDERCIVITTAKKLYNKVSQYRNRNHILVTNGVEYEHFNKKFKENEMPSEIRNLKNKYKYIIGYFGALAKWFDYEAIKTLAINKPNYCILLIGWDYDGSLKLSRIEELENVKIIGPIEYRLLPKYAFWFDVSTIPFLINDVTKSTSPIKLFEYMSLGRPIVTSKLPECLKHKDIVLTYDNSRDFVKKIDEALKLKNEKVYLEKLKTEALNNTWEKKAKQIMKIVKENL